MTRAAVARRPELRSRRRGARDGAHLRGGASRVEYRRHRHRRSGRCDPRTATRSSCCCSATQRWITDDLFDQFFAWKHEQNPFGPSPAWVATVGGSSRRLAYVRALGVRPSGRTGAHALFARWTPRRIPTSRAAAIFRRLTTARASTSSRADGVDFIFNTPNDKSRPGYLKMGWQEVGRLPAAVRPPGRLASRGCCAPASPPTGGRNPAPPANPRSTSSPATPLTACCPGSRRRADCARGARRTTCAGGTGSPRSRTGQSLSTTTRSTASRSSVSERGAATEAALCDVIVPSGDEAATRALERAVARTSKADYVIRLGGSDITTGYTRLPGQGPNLTWRAVADGQVAPDLTDWQLQLGDVELF